MLLELRLCFPSPIFEVPCPSPIFEVDMWLRFSRTPTHRKFETSQAYENFHEASLHFLFLLSDKASTFFYFFSTTKPLHFFISFHLRLLTIKKP